MTLVDGFIDQWNEENWFCYWHTGDDEDDYEPNDNDYVFKPNLERKTVPGLSDTRPLLVSPNAVPTTTITTTSTTTASTSTATTETGVAPRRSKRLRMSMSTSTDTSTVPGYIQNLQTMMQNCNHITTISVGSESDADWCTFAIPWKTNDVTDDTDAGDSASASADADADTSVDGPLTPYTLATKLGAHPKLIESIHSLRHVGYGRGNDIYNASIKGRSVAFTKEALEAVPSNLLPRIEGAIVAAGGIYKGIEVGDNTVSVLVYVSNLDNDVEGQREQMVQFDESLASASSLSSLYCGFYCPPPPPALPSSANATTLNNSTLRKMVLPLDIFFVNVDLPEEYLINIGELKCDNPPQSLQGLNIFINDDTSTPFDREKLEEIAKSAGAATIIEWDYSKGMEQCNSWKAKKKTVVVATSDFTETQRDEYTAVKNRGVRFVTMEQFLTIAGSDLGEKPSREEYLIDPEDDEDGTDNEFTVALNQELLNKKNGIAFCMGQNLMNPYPIFCITHDANENVVYGFISALVST
eukprot:CAMPEP_0203666654 /NCGR_PEP_ID=MMETSP0090-20130426/3657_1 /ASSEMBLY_ACC=CAM_ASM_001088 /TAXON_ID=426623 /ORGANISM="Chaetoceros affinis, Strain CCMP159" /LENGTH=525 /DNA_ID=CAMNT_0050530601 /DNA_START=160 /DNA_END=1737 /DNA_ORIENTATION=-